MNLRARSRGKIAPFEVTRTEEELRRAREELRALRELRGKGSSLSDPLISSIDPPEPSKPSEPSVSPEAKPPGPGSVAPGMSFSIPKGGKSKKKGVTDFVLDYTPQPKQALLHGSPANEILYGGAAGPGKSHALRMEGLIWCLRVPKLQVYLFRRIFPELEKNHIIPSLEMFPREVGNYKEQKRRWEFQNGAMLHFCHAQHENDIFAYQGAEINLLLIDELTTFTEFQYDYLRGRVRCALNFEKMGLPADYRKKIPGIICASNPGGIGHSFVKARWVDFAKPYELKYADRKMGGMLRCYIPGLLEDNKILAESDPGYIDRLDALVEPYRTAYKTGNWDIFLGQAFAFRREHHVIEPMPIPDQAKIYFSFDYGFGAPFSCGWFWVDGDGRLYHFGEWYGQMPGGAINTGIRMTDSEIGEGIKRRERELGIEGRQIIRLAGPDCFSKKADYRGGGQGPSTAEVFAGMGIYITAGDPSRVLKLRQFHERLRIYPDARRPMLVVYNTCENFIRSVPLLQADKNNVEDVDSRMEDHCYDMAALVCMARPLALNVPNLQKRGTADARIEMLTKGGLVSGNTFEGLAIRDERINQREIRGAMTMEEFMEYGDIPFNDGLTRPTVGASSVGRLH